MKCDRFPGRIRKLFPLPYPVRFSYRLALFFTMLSCYFLAPQTLVFPGSRTLSLLSVPVVLLCLSMTLNMAAQHFRLPNMSVARLKQYSPFCDIDPDYDRAQLKEEVRRQNRGALKVALLWLAVNGVAAILFFRSIIGAAELVLLTAFFYLSDMICILFFCPFQMFLMGNRCCINCRIYSWGAWMMSVPLTLIPSVVTLIPVVLSLSLLIRWEIHYHRHPERFWSGSNQVLRCANCREHLCRTKPVPTPGFRQEDS